MRDNGFPVITRWWWSGRKTMRTALKPEIIEAAVEAAVDNAGGVNEKGADDAAATIGAYGAAATVGTVAAAMVSEEEFGDAWVDGVI